MIDAINLFASLAIGFGLMCVPVGCVAFAAAKIVEWRHESGETERDELEYMLRDWLRARDRQ